LPEILRIEFIDSGIGVAPEIQARILNAFEQGSDNVTEKFGGLGLGLAIAKAITDLHNGRIWVESKGTGRGANFMIELPTMSVGNRVEEAPPV